MDDQQPAEQPTEQPHEHRDGRTDGGTDVDARATPAQPVEASPVPGPEDNTNLEPWEIHDAVMDSANETRDAKLEFVVERNGREIEGELQCTLHMPDWGKYQAVVGALPDALIEWMEAVAEEYGNEREFEDIVQDDEVDVPRIVWDEECVQQFRRILDGNLEHTPPEGRDKLTETPLRDLIYNMNPNTALAGLAFAAIEMSSNRDGVRNFRVE